MLTHDFARVVLTPLLAAAAGSSRALQPKLLCGRKVLLVARTPSRVAERAMGGHYACFDNLGDQSR